MAKTKITLEDEGQDLLWLIIENNTVVDGGPFHGGLYEGAIVPMVNVKVGELLPIHHPPLIEYGFLRYIVEKVEQI